MGDHNFPVNLDIHPLAHRHPNRDSSSTATLADADQQRQWINKFGIAGRIWEAAPYLASYLTPDSHATFDPPCSLFTTSSALPPVILELGSGNGFLGIDHLAPLLPSGSSLTLTDLQEVIPLLESNADRAEKSAIIELQVRPLAWGNEQDAVEALRAIKANGKKITHILCSDLVYFPHLLEPLLRSLLWLTNDQGGADIEVIIGYKIRSLTKETTFWHAFGAYFEFDVVHRKVQHDAMESGAIDEEEGLFIFLARRRKDTVCPSGQLPSRVMDRTDGRFEEILMLQSMPDTF